jgi:hypothetical protein
MNRLIISVLKTKMAITWHPIAIAVYFAMDAFGDVNGYGF